MAIVPRLLPRETYWMFPNADWVVPRLSKSRSPRWKWFAVRFVSAEKEANVFGRLHTSIWMSVEKRCHAFAPLNKETSCVMLPNKLSCCRACCWLFLLVLFYPLFNWIQSITEWKIVICNPACNIWRSEILNWCVFVLRLQGFISLIYFFKPLPGFCRGPGGESAQGFWLI